MSLTERATAKISGVCPRYPLPERQWARRLERPLQQRSHTHFGYDCRFAITEVMFFIFAVENSKPELCERYEISRVPGPHRLQEDVQCGKRQHAGALFPGSSFGRGHSLRHCRPDGMVRNSLPSYFRIVPPTFPLYRRHFPVGFFQQHALLPGEPSVDFLKAQHSSDFSRKANHFPGFARAACLPPPGKSVADAISLFPRKKNSVFFILTVDFLPLFGII